MIGEPANTESFFVNGRDWGYHMNLHLTFLEAHVLRGLSHCNQTWVVTDPTGFTQKEIRLDSDWFHDAHQRFLQRFLFNEVEWGFSPVSTCTDYIYKTTVSVHGCPYSGCNRQIVAPSRALYSQITPTRGGSPTWRKSCR